MLNLGCASDKQTTRESVKMLQIIFDIEINLKKTILFSAPITTQMTLAVYSIVVVVNIRASYAKCSKMLLSFIARRILTSRKSSNINVMRN